MIDIFGLPQPLTGEELVTISQMQNGNWAQCTMPLSSMAAIVFTSLPTIKPSSPGIPWNNGGVVSIS